MKIKLINIQIKMKDSLRQKLNDLIRTKGYIPSYEMEAFCRNNNYKPSNGERRLRPSESPNVERIFKGSAIVGYRWKQSETVTNFLRDFPSKPAHEIAQDIQVQLTGTLF